jgi:hypothetical protein
MAVWAQKPQILKRVVRSIAVDVIEFERYGPALPSAAVARSTARFQLTLSDESPAQPVAVVGRVGNENRLQRNAKRMPIASSTQVGLASPVRDIEAILTNAGANAPVVGSGDSQSKRAKRACHGIRTRDDGGEFFARPSHLPLHRMRIPAHARRVSNSFGLFPTFES